MRRWMVLTSLLLALAVAWPVRATDDAKKDDSKTAAQDKKKDDAKTTPTDKNDDKKKTDAKKSDKPAAKATDKKKAAKDDDKDKTAEKPVKKEKMQTVAVLTGVVHYINPQTKALTVGVPVGRLEGDWRNLHLSQSLHDIVIHVGDSPTVRRLHPAPLMDDRGRPKRYTRKELKELKGPNRKAWGYNAEFEDVKTDEVVKIWLGHPKMTGHHKLSRKELEKELANPENRPMAYQIYILYEPPIR